MAADAKQFHIEGYMNWRRAIFTQGIALYIIAAFIMCYPNEKIDIMAVPEETQSGTRVTDSQLNLAQNTPRSSRREASQGVPVLGDIFSIICNPIYMSTMLIITSMYFSGTGL